MRSVMPASRQGAAVARPRRRRGGLLVLLLVMLGYLFWPYLTLWRLDRALIRNDQAALAELVDLDAVREAILRQLNKEASGTIGPFSDEFIAWLERGIRRDGTAALEDRVDLTWVRERMLAQSPPGAGLVPAVARAFFDGPRQFSLRLWRSTARTRCTCAWGSPVCAGRCRRCTTEMEGAKTCPVNKVNSPRHTGRWYRRNAADTRSSRIAGR